MTELGRGGNGGGWENDQSLLPKALFNDDNVPHKEEGGREEGGKMINHLSSPKALSSGNSVPHKEKGSLERGENFSL